MSNEAKNFSGYPDLDTPNANTIFVVQHTANGITNTYNITTEALSSYVNSHITPTVNTSVLTVSSEGSSMYFMTANIDVLFVTFDDANTITVVLPSSAPCKKFTIKNTTFKTDTITVRGSNNVTTKIDDQDYISTNTAYGVIEVIKYNEANNASYMVLNLR